MIRFHDDWDEDGHEDDDEDETPEEGDDLDECPRCGRSIYDDSVRCPRCGHYLGGAGERSTTGQPLWVRVVAAILLGLMFYELARLVQLIQF